MYVNAGLLTLIYPFLVFGYALLEETRPRKKFWEFIRKYNQVVVFMKFIFNLSIVSDLMENKAWMSFAAWLKPGIEKQELPGLVMYMLPEILIMILLMLNEINLRLSGLYYQIESDIETVPDGIQRNIAKGDLDLVQEMKI